jgi:hypothetical protein
VAALEQLDDAQARSGRLFPALLASEAGHQAPHLMRGCRHLLALFPECFDLKDQFST